MWELRLEPDTTTRLRLWHRALTSDAFCLHKIGGIFRNPCHCDKGSPEEWLAVARSDANERALLFSLENDAFPVALESISRICSPSSWVVNRCLVLLRATGRDIKSVGLHQEALKVKEWLLKHLPADEARKWLASLSEARGSEDDSEIDEDDGDNLENDSEGDGSGDSEDNDQDNGEGDDNDDDEDKNNDEDRDEDDDDGGVKLG